LCVLCVCVFRVKKKVFLYSGYPFLKTCIFCSQIFFLWLHHLFFSTCGKKAAFIHDHPHPYSPSIFFFNQFSPIDISGLLVSYSTAHSSSALPSTVHSFESISFFLSTFLSFFPPQYCLVTTTLVSIVGLHLNMLLCLLKKNMILPSANVVAV